MLHFDFQKNAPRAEIYMKGLLVVFGERIAFHIN